MLREAAQGNKDNKRCEGKWIGNTQGKKKKIDMQLSRLRSLKVEFKSICFDVQFERRLNAEK